MTIAPELTPPQRLRRLRETLDGFRALAATYASDHREVFKRGVPLTNQLLSDLAALEVGGQLAEIEDFLITMYGG